MTPELFKQALREHAYEMGIDPDAEEEFMWIVEESLLAPLSDGWVQLRQEGHDRPVNAGSRPRRRAPLVAGSPACCCRAPARRTAPRSCAP